MHFMRKVRGIELLIYQSEVKVKCYKVLKQRCRSCTTQNQVTAESKIIDIYT